MQWLDTVTSLRLRDFFPKFEEKFGEAAEGMDNAKKAYGEALTKFEGATHADAEKNEALTKIKAELGKIKEARGKLEEVAELSKDGWVGKNGKSASLVKSTLDKYKAAHTKFESALGTAKDGEAAELTAFREVFTELKTTAGKAHGLMGNPFGMARMNGWHGIGETAKHNLEGMQFWKEGIVPTKRMPAVAFRAGALVAAGGAITDSIIRSRTNDGEDRSFVSRVMEAAGGAGLASAALLAGRAL